MFVTLSNFSRKIHVQVATLIPILLLSLFSIAPMVTTQSAPNLAKISPILLEKLAYDCGFVNVLIKTTTNDYVSLASSLNM